MRKVMSFRLDAKAAEGARVRATTKGKKITAYLEDLVSERPDGRTEVASDVGGSYSVAAHQSSRA